MCRLPSSTIRSTAFEADVERDTELTVAGLAHDLNNVFETLAESAELLGRDPKWARLAATIRRRPGLRWAACPFCSSCWRCHSGGPEPAGGMSLTTRKPIWPEEKSVS